MYTLRDLAEFAGVTTHTIRSWKYYGVIPRAKGRTRGAYYTDEHLRAIRDYLATCVDGRVTAAEFAERHGRSRPA